MRPSSCFFLHLLQTRGPWLFWRAYSDSGFGARVAGDGALGSVPTFPFSPLSVFFLRRAAPRERERVMLHRSVAIGTLFAFPSERFRGYWLSNGIQTLKLSSQVGLEK